MDKGNIKTEEFTWLNYEIAQTVVGYLIIMG